eukprot:scaffold87176_cov60-Phaeocystis_antarctica.AAC.3
MGRRTAAGAAPPDRGGGGLWRCREGALVMQRRLGCGGAQVEQLEERAEHLARLPVGAHECREPTP